MSLRISQRQKRGGLRNEGKGVGMTEEEIEIAALSSKARNDGIITPTLILPPQGEGKYDGILLCLLKEEENTLEMILKI